MKDTVYIIHGGNRKEGTTFISTNGYVNKAACVRMVKMMRKDNPGFEFHITGIKIVA